MLIILLNNIYLYVFILFFFLKKNIYIYIYPPHWAYGPAQAAEASLIVLNIPIIVFNLIFKRFIF